MKWKYFLRGLGVGLLVATLVLCIAYRNNKSTAPDVVKEAKKLGMVFPEGTQPPPDEDEIVERTKKPSESPEATEKSSDSDKKKATATPKAKDSSQSSSDKSSSDKSNTGKSSSTKNKSTSEKSSKKTTEKKKASSEQEDPVIQVTVRDASTSIAAVRELAAAGVISDILEFDHFLRDNGYSPRVRAGIYSIPKNATYDQIAKIITHQT